MKGHKLILFCLLILSFSQTMALSTDREQPIQIEADKATIDNMKGTAVYEGNVIVMQGSIRLNAATVTLNYNDQNDIEKVVAMGQPTHFKQRLDSGEEIKAKAKEMEYNAVKDMLHLRVEAELRKERNGEDTYTSTAPRITYDTQRGIITADKGKNKKGRITMTLKPQPQSSRQ